MRVLTINELMRLTRTELCRLFAQITSELATLPEGSPERDIALMNLRNIAPSWRAATSRPSGGARPRMRRMSVYPSRSLVRLHTFESFPDLRFGDLERLRLVHGLLPFPVGPWPRLNNAAPSLQLHYKAFVATTGCSVPALRVGTLALAVGTACGLSLHSTQRTAARDAAQVLTFHTTAWSSFALPTRRMPLGRSQDIHRADPGGRVTPRF